MNKNILTAAALCTALLLTLHSTAQVGAPDSSTRYFQAPKPASWYTQHMRVQAGFNATGFIKQFLSFNTITATANPIDFNAKVLYRCEANSAWLYGFRGGIGYTDNRISTTSNTSSNENTSDNHTLTFRVGLEAQQALSRRWSLYYGVDYFRSTSNNTSVNNSDNGSTSSYSKSESDSKTSGFGPVIGVQFNINRHICLATELTFYRLITTGGSVTDASTTFSGGTISTTHTESIANNRSASIQPPNFINFNIIF